jgi:predicted alpha/beta hydrolase
VHSVDYRGIGRSKPARLRGFRMDYRDWGRRDLAALVEQAHGLADADGVPLVMIGHSYGGHALGLLPNHARLRACWTFATGAGWSGWMPRLERVRVHAMWNVMGPLMVARHGYLKWSKLGMGEDLPLDVYRQWKHWCGYPRYFFDDPEVGAGLRAEFARVRMPIVAANALDDRWAPPRSRDAFMAAYTGASVEARDVAPRAHGLRGVGHMGYFRPQARVLWDEALDWLGARAAA